MDITSIIVLIGVLALLIVTLVLVIWLVNFLGTNREDGDVAEHLTEIAVQLGWKYDERKKRFEGIHQGRQVTVDQFDLSDSVAGDALNIAALGSSLLGSSLPGSEIVGPAVDGLLRSRVRLIMAVTNPSKGYMSMVRTTRHLDSRLFSRGRTGFEDIDQQFEIESKPKEFAGNMLASEDLQSQLLEAAKVRQLSVVVKKSQVDMRVEALEISEAAILAIAEIASGFSDAVERADNTERAQVGWVFWLGWASANTVGLAAGFAVAFALTVAVRNNVGEVVLFAVIGASLGIAQWLVLGGLVARAGWWVLASTVGRVVGLAVGAAVVEVGGEALSSALVGASVGIAQWLVLRRQVSRAGWWVLASTVGLVVGTAVSFGATDPLLEARAVALAAVGLAIVVRGAVGGAVFGALTGGVLVWLFRQPITEEHLPQDAA